ncbi:DUF4382 domain-containing protein [uncultured Desulfuromonas sp.]|mgnify:CR=1 FL=1|uniref:DUF4382 domain-containing protein n=1 Tax=uncultured Desulfuromonas sp. TaxID=181013 RepID=UPI0026040A0C|nr:DUF4382 domain-containing protein [uncultured Desulfuromonas sp.]
MQLLFTDTPNLAIEAGTLSVGQVAMHRTGGPWVNFLDERMELDLLEMEEEPALFGEFHVQPGKYTQIRLQSIDAEVTVNGVTYDVEVPSGEFKVNCNFRIDSGGLWELVVNLGAQNSLRYNKGKDLYKMKPVLELESATDVEEDPAQ